jgi:phage gp29-like protein
MLLPNATGLDASALRQTLIRREVPEDEMYRRTFGRSLDLDVIKNCLEGANVGYMVDLCDLESESMAMDPHLSGTLAKRFGQVMTADFDVTPPKGLTGTDKKWAEIAADQNRKTLQRLPDFRQTLYDIAWAIFDGRSAMEVHWLEATGAGRDEFRWRPFDLSWIHPRRLSFGPARELRVIDPMRGVSYFRPENGWALEDFPGKFVWYKPRLFREYAEREGLGPRCLYWAFFKRFSWRMRMLLTELFGIPWRIVTLEKDAPIGGELLKNAKVEAEKLGGETTGAFGPGVKVDVVFPGENEGGLFSMTDKDVDAQMSKLVLGNVGTTDAVANRAESIVQKGEQDILFQRDGGGVSERVNSQFMLPMTVANLGRDAAHIASVFQIRTQPPRDRKAELDRVSVVVGWGIPVAVSAVREMGGLEAPQPGEAYIVGAPGGKDSFGNPLPAKVKVVDPNASPDPADGGGGQQSGEGDATDPGMAAGQLPADGGPEAAGVEGQAAAALRDMLGLSREGEVVSGAFAGYDDIEACVIDQMANGADEESARRICGALQTKVEAERRAVAARLAAVGRARPLW